MSHNRLVVIGLIGGIGSGKSTVAGLLARSLSAAILSADQIGHEVLALPEVKNAIRSRWGESVFLPGQNVLDRALLAARVFAPDAKNERLFLESLTHPLIKSRIEDSCRALSLSGKKVVILDAPLLIETKLNNMCDIIIFVSTSKKTRETRVRDRNWTEDELAKRENSQLSLKEKQFFADYVLDNNGSYEKINIRILSLVEEFHEKGLIP